MALPSTEVVVRGANRGFPEESVQAGRTGKRRGASLDRSAGLTLVELLTCMAILALAVAVGAPGLASIVRNHQLRAGTAIVESVVTYARFKAVKERVPHRILIHDLSASPANCLMLQSYQGGSYVTLSNQTYAMPSKITILGSSPTDSLDSLDITARGQCTAGTVYLQNTNGTTSRVMIETPCISSVL